jgi:hypothetical protein
MLASVCNFRLTVTLIVSDYALSFEQPKHVRRMKKKLFALLVIVATVVTTTTVVVAEPDPSGEPPLAPGHVCMSVNAGAAIAGQDFDIQGQLVAFAPSREGAPVTQVPQSGFTVTVRDGSTDLGSDIDTAVSDANGKYKFTIAKPAGTYRFGVSTRYRLGPGPYDRYATGTSLDVTVIDNLLGSAKTPTTLDVFSPANHTIMAWTRDQFAVTGWLTNDSAISGASVTLQQWVGTAWIAVKSTPTNAEGRCTFTHSINERGTYYIRMQYEGSTESAQSSSEFVKVTVSEKRA